MSLEIEVIDYDDYYESKTLFSGKGKLLKIKVGKQSYQIRATLRDGLRIIPTGHDDAESTDGFRPIILPNDREVTVVSEASMEKFCKRQ
jgi:hypothetical protein